SVSADFRRSIKDILASSRGVWAALLMVTALAILSIGISSEPGMSANKVVVVLMNWTAIFVLSCYIFAQDGRAMRFAYILWVLVLFWCVAGAWEWRISRLPWAGHIPSFLAIEDENVQKLLAGSSRAATGKYRVQAKFTTSLGFSEFMALAMPFILHIGMTSRRFIEKIAAFATLPVMFWTIINTDSRLGVVGFLMTIMLYLLAWGAFRWKSSQGSLFGPAITLAYPALFAAFISATFFIGRLRAMVWGTGAQQFSTDARQEQWAMAIPKALTHPWGYGIGRGAESLGFTNLAGVLTIDSYFLTVLLEFGILGFLVYFGMILAGIVQGAYQCLISGGTRMGLLAPAAIALMNFVIIKSVLSQQENHPAMFMILGMVVALIWRERRAAPTTGVPVLARGAHA
ncbi:MAG: O-antigen ligase family protein, partial [Sphingopyxis sp.]